MAKPLIVCEVGINHAGDMRIAKALIGLAAANGADLCKFQKRNVDKVYTEEYLRGKVATRWGKTKRAEKLGLEFGKDEYDEIDAYCTKLGIGWFASPWDVESAEFLAQYKPPFMKLASVCMTREDLVEKLIEIGIPIIMSTGMAERAQVEDVGEHLLEKDALAYVLHAKALYPCPHHEMNMKAIRTLQEMFGGRAKIGFSNHSEEIIYTVQACAMGADMVEFHITLDRNMAGADQFSSIGPVGFLRIMDHLANIEQGWGDGVIHALPAELDKASHYLWRQ